MILEAAPKGLLPSGSPGPGPSSEAADCTQTLKWWMFTWLYYSVGLRSMESNLTHTSRNLLEPSQGHRLTGNSSRWISFSVRIFTCSPRYQADSLTINLHWIRLFQMSIWSSHSSAANISMTSYCSLKKTKNKVWLEKYHDQTLLILPHLLPLTHVQRHLCLSQVPHATWNSLPNFRLERG